MLKRFAPILLAVCALGVFGAPASAEIPGPGWELTARSYPTNLAPGARGTLAVEVFNVGAGASHGPITVTDTLPPGIVATGEAGMLHRAAEPEEPFIESGVWDCSGNGPGKAVAGATIVTCVNDPVGLPEFAGGGGRPNHTGPNLQPEIGIAVSVPNTKEMENTKSGSEANHVTIAGGGASTPASTSDPVTVSSTPASFGFAGWDAWLSNANGTLDTQAGSHPYDATFSFDFNTVLNKGERFPAGEVRNIEVLLPPGFVGNPNAVPQCTRQELDASKCPNASQVGIVTVAFGGIQDQDFRLFNIVPPPGVPADFAFTIEGINTHLDSTVRSGSDYGITTHIDNNVQDVIIGAITTLWGFPEDPSHDRWRGTVPGGCTSEELAHSGTECSGFPRPILKPFLTLPTSCGTPQKVTIRATSWDPSFKPAESSFALHDSNDNPTGFTGCEDLSFGPTLSAAPDTSDADTPTGLTVEVKPPLGGLEEFGGLSTSDIQNTKVTLPKGLVINPGQAAGLQACQPSQDGLEPLPDGEEDNGPPSCPLASKVGTVKAKTPLLEGAAEKELEGDVYVLKSNPPNLKLLAAFSADGVNIKLVLNVHLDETTGQLTTTVANVPQFPVSDFKLSFSGGAQAALDTPAGCGEYATTSDFTPWGSPFVADALPSGTFDITHGPGGGPCPSSSLPFSPSLIAGATTDQAGGFTNFSLLLQRGDGQQRIDGLKFKAPEGLTGFLSKVPLCTNAQAEANECPAASKIGHTVVESGPGPYPLVVPEPGQEPAPIYLTESYDGAPFGLSIVVPLHVGPFTLPTQRVRAKIEVDPHTSALTVTTDPLPQVVAGVPTDLREIDAVIERPEFMVNPTNCDPQEFSGTAYGTPPPGQGGPGASAAISSRFQVGACRALKFEPKFSVTTSGKTSKANGASLTAKVTYPSVPQGTEADIGYVKVELPKALPSRLTTLQKACTNAQFEANPAGCPSASFIGHAVVHTPLLPVPLEGPAIFVSHGGEAFPSLTIVLQGDGVTVDLVGATFINKAGVTSTTFKTVPDDPFSSFELTLPQGPYSALAANGDLCSLTKTVTSRKKATVRVRGRRIKKTVVTRRTVSASLTMPYEFIGQNGAMIKQTAAIGVSGCTKAAVKKAKSHKAKRRKR